MKRVIIESPYAGNVTRNVAYARECMRDSLMRGEAPYASHLLYTQGGVLDDTLPNEREIGIRAGLAWAAVAELRVFYADLGFSLGMLAARREYYEKGLSYEVRYLHPEMRGKCPKCGSFDLRPARGMLCCYECGAVVAEDVVR